MKSPKELSLDSKLRKTLHSLNAGKKAEEGLELLLTDEEIQAAQEYANTVSIVRLGYNDHGPVHMRTVALNALIMLGLLRDAGVKTSLEHDGCGVFEDSALACLFAAFLHDLGMGVGRKDHELHSAYMAYPIIDRLLVHLFREEPGGMARRVTIRGMAIEAIYGHMGNHTICSLEAGVVQAADGCDMEKGRARIPIALSQEPKMGDIHQYSANCIENVTISKGAEKPIAVHIDMSSELGIFQVEEVLMQKISGGTVNPYIELYACLAGHEPRRYL
jgi:metal-dependent HD superfamily phosphatase/phosphodiesterase